MRRDIIKLINFWMSSTIESLAYTLNLRYAQNCSIGCILGALYDLWDKGDALLAVMFENNMIALLNKVLTAGKV